MARAAKRAIEKRTAEPKPTVGLRDEDLVAVARKYRAARTNELQARTAADELRSQLLDEMKRRKQQTAELDNVVVTVKRKRQRDWDLDALRARLNRTQLRQVLTETVSTPAINALVKEGVLQKVTRVVDGVECELVDGVEVVSWSSPYVDVTLRDG